MYCAYTIPGMTGSSLMYYYNGKAVRPALHPSRGLPPPESEGVREKEARARVCARERRR